MMPAITDALLSTSLMVNSISSGAASRAAQYVAQKRDESRAQLQESVYFGGVFDELYGMYEQCRDQNWDGYGAPSIEEQTYRNTRRLLESLWLRTPAPSISAEADGDLTLEWYKSARRTLSVSVTRDGYLHYAALLDDSKAYGSAPLSTDVPSVILNLIRQVSA